MGQNKHVSLKDRIEPRGERFQILHTCEGETVFQGTLAPGMFWRYVRELEGKSKSAKWAKGEHLIVLRVGTPREMILSGSVVDEINALFNRHLEELQATYVSPAWMSNIGGLISEYLGGMLKVFTVLAIAGSGKPTFAEFLAKGTEMFPIPRRKVLKGRQDGSSNSSSSAAIVAGSAD
jgi:hypothetical protein